MDKISQIRAYASAGRDWAINSLYDKVASGDADAETGAALDELVEKYASEAIEGRLFSEKVATINSVISLLDEADMKDAAGLLSKVAQEELADVELPEEGGEEMGEEEMGEEEVSDEEAAAAAVQGAAEVLSDLTGVDQDDPELQAAAEEIVQEAVAEAPADEEEE